VRVDSDDHEVGDGSMRKQDRDSKLGGYLASLGWFLAVAGFLATLALDRVVYTQVFVENPQIQDWYRLFRVGGYLPFWLMVALAWLLIDSAAFRTCGLRTVLRRGLLLGLSVVAAGALGEVLKVLIRRERPGLHDGSYFFRSWLDRPFDSSGLGLPSGHATVAFAAAWVLCRLYPRAMPVWLLLGVGCALSRLLDRAHFLSDVYLAGLFTYVLVRLLWPLFEDWGRTPPSDSLRGRGQEIGSKGGK
jgi:membrane-associated phospholipid phosphatase